MLALLGIAILAAPVWPQQTGDVRGRVVDARGGERLKNVQVQLRGTAFRVVTDAEGSFVLAGVPPGAYVLHVSMVGYRLVTQNFTLAPGEAKEFEVVLTPDTLRQTDTVEVRAGPFEAAREDSPSRLSLQGEEAKNLASVLADDPLRAVQTLPGVTSDDDFSSRFSLRGADYDRIGLYLDNIKLHAPFHMVAGEPASGSLTVFNGDTLDGLELQSGGFPSRYADATAGALGAETREGSRLGPSLRLTASASNSGALAEGPLGHSRRGAWLASVRKSYLQYVVRRVTDDPSLAFGFFDVQGKITYDLDRRNTVSLSVIDGDSGLDRSNARPWLGINTTMTSGFHFTLADLAWRYTPHERLVVTNRAAWLRERIDNRNPQNLALLGGQYGEWVWDLEGSWLARGSNPVDFGWTLRRIRDDGFTNQYQFNPFAVRVLNPFRGTGLRTGGFIEPTWRFAGGRVVLATGARWDRHSVDQVEALSPHAALSFLVGPSTRVQLGWGQYVQYPDLQDFFIPFGSPGLLPERANHVVAALEQRLDERTRVRAEFYWRGDRDVLFRPWFEPRLIGGGVFNPPLDAPVQNALRGYARGFEVFLQRRSANRLTGWISYAYGTTRLRDDVLGLAFPADFDQRHTVNIYSSYRLRPTVNLSVKALYGSGFPVPGFYRQVGKQYFLAPARNQARLDAYQRADFRINKAYVYGRWKLTLYGEAVNLLNRDNYRYETLNGINPTTQQAYVSLEKLLPILPSAGIVLEF